MTKFLNQKKTYFRLKKAYSIYPVPDSMVIFFLLNASNQINGEDTFFCKTQQDMKPQMKLFVLLLTITSCFVFCRFSLFFRREFENTLLFCFFKRKWNKKWFHVMTRSASCDAICEYAQCTQK